MGWAGWWFSSNQVGLALRNLLLKVVICCLSLVPTAEARAALFLGPNLASASLNWAISASPHFVRAVADPLCLSFSTASLAHFSLASLICCSLMCWEHKHVDGKVRGPNGMPSRWTHRCLREGPPLHVPAYSDSPSPVALTYSHSAH